MDKKNDHIIVEKGGHYYLADSVMYNGEQLLKLNRDQATFPDIPGKDDIFLPDRQGPTKRDGIRGGWVHLHDVLNQQEVRASLEKGEARVGRVIEGNSPASKKPEFSQGASRAPAADQSTEYGGKDRGVSGAALPSPSKQETPKKSPLHPKSVHEAVKDDSFKLNTTQGLKNYVAGVKEALDQEERDRRFGRRNSMVASFNQLQSNAPAKPAQAANSTQYYTGVTRNGGERIPISRTEPTRLAANSPVPSHPPVRPVARNQGLLQNGVASLPMPPAQPKKEENGLWGWLVAGAAGLLGFVGLAAFAGPVVGLGIAAALAVGAYYAYKYIKANPSSAPQQPAPMMNQSHATQPGQGRQMGMPASGHGLPSTAVTTGKEQPQRPMQP